MLSSRIPAVTYFILPALLLNRTYLRNTCTSILRIKEIYRNTTSILRITKTYKFE